MSSVIPGVEVEFSIALICRRLYIGLVAMVAQQMGPFQTLQCLAALHNITTPSLKAIVLALVEACPLSVVNTPCNSTPPRER